MSGLKRSVLPLIVTSLVLGFIAKGPVSTVAQGGVTSEGPVARTGTTGPVAEGPVAERGGPADVGPIVEQGGGSGGGPAGVALSCAPGKNGGATDKGVSASQIKLATTYVASGNAASLLRDSLVGMRAVIANVNAKGGVCNRRLTLEAVDDGFDANRGQRFLENFIAGDYFALPVVPSAEGLGAAIRAGDMRRSGIPVVGTDGMRREQYEDSWVWPVATATESTMRIMAWYGKKVRKAQSFAIVYDNKYQFGKEGKDAFVAEVKRLGGTMVHEQPLNPDQSSYSSEVQAFNAKCKGGNCDMVAFLLLPDAARAWMTKQPALGVVYTAGAQTLFTDQFARDCVTARSEECHGIAVWTGYNPPIGRFAGLPDVAAYTDDVQTVKPGVDVTNQFLQGAYLGMSLFVEALREVGPNLTRARLRAVLDSMRHKSDITQALSWRQGDHRANVWARAFSLNVSQGAFRGWSDANSGWVKDPKGA